MIKQEDCPRAYTVQCCCKLLVLGGVLSSISDKAVFSPIQPFMTFKGFMARSVAITNQRGSEGALFKGCLWGTGNVHVLFFLASLSITQDKGDKITERLTLV